jgi:mannose-6-phosphate isomerase-like protein (cupin superfamily)
MDAFEIEDLGARRADRDQAYLEFLAVPDLSAGLYVLPAGGVDRQQPHTEDEIYYVVSGRATISVADDVRAVQAGSIVYVAAGVPHHFHDIAEDLSLLVVFGPAEYTRTAAP